MSGRMSASTWLTTIVVSLLFSCNVALAAPAPRAEASRYLFIFGDSYTTSVFDAPEHIRPIIEAPLGDPKFHESTSTGGRNWVDVVAANASTCGTVTYNYAVGGNTVNASRSHAGDFAPLSGPVTDMRDQEKEFLKNEVPWKSDNSIFMHWFGINDVAIQVWSGRNLNDSEAILKPDVDDYFGLLERQYGLGARHFVTMLMPPIHLAPVFGYGTNPSAPEIKALTEYWNEYMQVERDKFLRHYPDTTSVVFDPSPAFNRVLDDPHDYGLPQRKAKHGVGAMWHDFIHPGIDIQKEVGEDLCGVLQERWPC